MATQRADLADYPLPVRTRLSQPVRARIVELFATFHTLSQVREAIKEEFGHELAPMTLAHYDPSRNKTKLSPRLKAMHDEVRAAYVERATEVGIANRAHRLKLLSDIVAKATTAKDFGNAIKGLELAAKEMGGVLEGKTEVKHTGSVSHLHLSVDDAKNELRMRLQEVIDGGTLDALPAPADNGADNEAKSLIDNGNDADLT